jgi:hypothetical protein
MPQKIRVNTANEQELLEVPGLRPADASAIVRFRDEHGPIKDAAQLSSVLGGRELDETTRQRVDFDGGPRYGPPNPPTFGSAPAQPWRASSSRAPLAVPTRVFRGRPSRVRVGGA